MKNVDVQPSFLIRDICAGGKGHMPPPLFCIEACIQMIYLANFSGPPSKIVPHFLVHSYSSANSMHV